MSGLIKNIAELIIKHIGTIKDLELKHEERIQRICEKHDMTPCARCDSLVSPPEAYKCIECLENVCKWCTTCTDEAYCIECTSNTKGGQRCADCGDNPLSGLTTLDCGCNVCVFRGQTRSKWDVNYKHKCINYK